MGKGVIISGGTDGQYQVSVQYNVQRVQAEKAANLAKIANLTEQISEETDEQKLKILKLQKLSLEKRNELLEAIPESKEITAWCADLTEDLTGEVGLIEVPGESTAFNIQPGHEGNAAFNAVRDGQLTPTMAMDPAAAFYSLAMLPGWQKWRPTYRYGTITEVHGDTADVVLDAALSSQQGLEVNQDTTLSNVPVNYMGCDAQVFEEWDEVLIQFRGQGWTDPMIVGFKDHPRICCIFDEFFLGEEVEYIWDIIGTTPDNDSYQRAAWNGVFEPESSHTTEVIQTPEYWQIKYLANTSVVRFQRESDQHESCIDGSMKHMPVGTTLYWTSGEFGRCWFETDPFPHGVNRSFQKPLWLVIDMELVALAGDGPLLFTDDIYFQARLKFHDESVGWPYGPWFPNIYGAETDLVLRPDDEAGRKRYATDIKDLFNSYLGRPDLVVMLWAYFPYADDDGWTFSSGCDAGALKLFTSNQGPMTHEMDAKIYSITICATDPPEDAIIF